MEIEEISFYKYLSVHLTSAAAPSDAVIERSSILPQAEF
jgi:hypothetical protein